MPSAEQITALGTLIASVGVIITAILQYLARDKVKALAAKTEEVHTAVSSGNGQTLGMNADAIREAVAPVTSDTPPMPSA